MVGWHHRLNGHEFESTLEVGDGQGSLAYCSPWDFPGKNTDSVQFSHSVVSDSMPPHESQHTRPPCPSSTLGVYPNSCPLSQ